jgi:hypothetical protein
MGWIKGKVYRRKVDTRDALPDHVVNIIARIKERRGLLRRATRHIITRVAKCIDVDGGIFESVLYWVAGHGSRAV